MTTKAELLRTIRLNCIDCMGGHPGYVKECTSGNCRMYPFRMGADPRPNQAKAELARRMNAQKPTQVRDVLLPEFAKEIEPVGYTE